MSANVIYEKKQIDAVLKLLDHVTVTGLQSMSNLVGIKMILESGKETKTKGALKDSSGEEKEDGDNEHR